MKKFVFIVFILLGTTLSFAQVKYSAELKIESVKKVVNDAAQWQIEHMPLTGRTPAINPQYTGWADGVFLSALADWAEYDNTLNFIKWYETIAEKQQWEVGNRSLNPANDVAVSLMYAKIWERKKTPRYLVSKIVNWDDKTIDNLAGGWSSIIPTIERLDYQMKYYPKTHNINFEVAQNQERWSWCDALYMAAPTYALYANITGNNEYREFMNREFWNTMETLYDKQEKLVFRDTRYVTMKEANGAKLFWGRGNGWVVASMARILNFLPADYPSRSKYEKRFQEIMSRIVTLQDKNGYWHTSLLDTVTYKSPETSASGFYTFALWWGINNGLLARKVYLQPAVKAWEAMVKAVQPDGMLGYVQPIGDAPQNVTAKKNEVYGTAAFMLSGLEVAKYVEKN
jgi:unsaturated rhamnogalacturonyl hydrolase